MQKEEEYYLSRRHFVRECTIVEDSACLAVDLTKGSGRPGRSYASPERYTHEVADQKMPGFVRNYNVSVFREQFLPCVCE